ncbi:MAG: sodium ion-translocating decarboxylase subunit beta, partial [Clostridia bacterium]|nr:sodium ion-translocating decarboxylase subunit beta [Clostridia bacterium]
MEILYENLLQLDLRQIVMWIIGGVLIFLAIKKEMEPTLLLPIGFGAILVNLPIFDNVEALVTLYNAGIANELFPLILFIGIGAMIDFGP